MAVTPADRRGRHELVLDIAHVTITEELPEAAAEWQSLSGAERASVAAQWGNDVKALQSVIAEYDRGSLDPQQEAVLLRVVDALIGARSSVERMGLYYYDLRAMQVLIGSHEKVCHGPL